MNKTLFEFVNIDDETDIKITTNLDSQTISNYNIYVDKNPFDIIKADPGNGMFYNIYNIYLIEGGVINIIGFKVRLGEIKKAEVVYYPIQMNAWINFLDNEVGKGIKRCKFNSGAFNQFIDNKILFTKEDNKIYKQHIKRTMPYNRPWNIIQKIIYTKGIKDAYKYKPTMKEIINTKLPPNMSYSQIPYFSLDKFYVEGMRAAWKEGKYDAESN